jgi:hypothetical protein
LVPICRFQASALVERFRWASKPTPRDVLRGGSAIIVVIRLPPLEKVPPGNLIRGIKFA